mgnify:FL=1
MKIIKLKQSELTKLIERVVKQNLLITEAISCHVTDNPCNVGTCLFDPNSNSMCCVENTAYGCMDGRVTNDYELEKTKGGTSNEVTPLGPGIIKPFAKPKGITQRRKNTDIDTLNKKGKIINYTPDGSSTSSYGKETTKLRESDLKRIINKVINEAKKCTYSFECKGGKICIGGRCKKNKYEKIVSPGTNKKGYKGGFNEEDESPNLMLMQQLAMMQAMDDEGRVSGESDLGRKKKYTK